MIQLSQLPTQIERYDSLIEQINEDEQFLKNIILLLNHSNNFIIMSIQADPKQKSLNSSSLQPHNTILKNNKITTRTNSHSAIPNYSNPRYHQGVDLAKAYSGFRMVDTHLYQSGFQNHALKSIRRYYDHSKDKEKSSSKLQNNSQIKQSMNQSPQLKRSKSLSTYKNKKIIFSSSSIKPIKVQNNRIIINNPQQPQKLNKQQQNKPTQSEDPQDKLDKIRAMQLRTVLSKKAQRVPEYSQEVQDVCNWKISLQNQIKKLKSLINNEKKHRVKLSLNCNKIMNENELTYKAYQTRAQENYHLSVACSTTEKEIQSLNFQIDNFKEKNKRTKENIKNQEEQVERLQDHVNKTRMILMGEDKDVAKLKAMVTTSYNNMSNNFMNMNLLKGQKALLLGDIEKQHAKNK